MKRVDLAQLESLCADVVRQLAELKSDEANAVSAELEYRMYRFSLVEGGLPATDEDVSALETDVAALDRVIARCARQREQLGPGASKQAADEVRHELRVQRLLAEELRHIIDQQLEATRAALAGEAQAELLEQMERARTLLMQPSTPAQKAGKPRRASKTKPPAEPEGE